MSGSEPLHPVHLRGKAAARARDPRINRTHRRKVEFGTNCTASSFHVSQPSSFKTLAEQWPEGPRHDNERPARPKQIMFEGDFGPCLNCKAPMTELPFLPKRDKPVRCRACAAGYRLSHPRPTVLNA